MIVRDSRAVVLATALALLAGVAPLRAALPPLTDADWAAKAPASEPKAPTVVLYKRAELRLRDLQKQEASSQLHVEQRIKVLTSEGLHGGEIELPHGREFRLDALHGRTVLPGGRELPLDATTKFERRVSKRSGTWVTAVAFPGVEVGAILELEADFRFDSILFLEPWYLSDSSPVLYSEVEYDVPKSLQALTWGKDPFQAGVQTEKSLGVQGFRFRAWAKNLPGVPREPFGPPFADLATQYGILTTAYSDAYQLTKLFESWQTTCAFVEERFYGPARRKDHGVAARARELVVAAKDPRQKAEAIYRFVRDQVRTRSDAGVLLAPDSTLEKVLADASGDYAEKGLLLQAMLDKVGIASHLVWANERSSGLARMDVPNPVWFERALVAAELPSGRVYLDPTEPSLPFGTLLADEEGSEAVLVDPHKPEVITLPALPAESNRRGATLALAIDGEGQVRGTGELVLSGQHAMRALAGSEPTKLVDEWTKWLQERFRGYDVSAVHVVAAPAGGELRVTWSMAQRAEDVLGDEVTLLPSRPLGPLVQPLTLPAQERLTPVVLPFPDRDEVTIELTYPTGWKVEALPAAMTIDSKVGGLTVQASNDAEKRTVRFARRLDVTLREGEGRGDYAQLRAFYDQVAKQDALALGLARR
jgi:hypothetical protein